MADLVKNMRIFDMITTFFKKIAEKVIKNLKIAVVGEGSELKFQLLYKNKVISEDFLLISSLEFKNTRKNGQKIH